MAAIEIADDRAWVVARWVWDYVVVAVQKHLPENSVTKKAVDAAVATGAYWLSLAELDNESWGQFRAAAVKVFAELQMASLSEFSTREGYEGLKARTAELVDMLGPR